MKIGTRIRFLTNLYEDADGDHPQFLLARAGDLGTITAEGWSSFDYAVMWDGFKQASFLCKASEIKEAE